MRVKTSFHTHTTYCDGVNTAREMIEAAIEKGFDAIGFSGHSHTDFDESYAMSLEDSRLYKREILELKEEYKDKIKVFCGLEYDYFSDEWITGWDFKIGSVHYVKKDGIYIPVDEAADILLDAVIEHYAGDVYALCEDYYAQMGNIVKKTECDIVGHFDLITKFNESCFTLPTGTIVPGGNGPMIDEKDPRYVAAYTAALDKILGEPGAKDRPEKRPLFEINTGAIYRGYRTAPYPSEDILRAIKARGGRVIITSDAHDTEALGFWYEEAEELATRLGFKL
ncbi:MAG: histidinol-phosphatase [Mogibacterium sp.]|nr:histidinol-phosphatase [Mogibacterium sp.]